MNYSEIFISTLADQYQMTVNGFSCSLNTPPALSGENEFGLPPYCPQTPYLVDKYIGCPKNWMRSEGKVKSYFASVKEGSGMWLDFNQNSNNNKHVAIVISIQGINPITGLPCNDSQLEQYIEECPKHKIKFGADRYCKKCDYKWPKQNYITTTSTPTGMLWLDGFRSIDGIVRQYILTSEKIKGVANNIISKDRVFAIGISFFTSNFDKPKYDYSLELKTTTDSTYKWPPYVEYPLNDYVGYPFNDCVIPTVTESKDIYSTSSLYSTSLKTDYSTNTCFRSVNTGTNNPETKYNHNGPLKSSVKCKQLEVGAGAKIKQCIYNDPEKIEFWNTQSEGVLCINYVTEKDCNKIIKQGENNVDGNPEGFLKDMPVGN